MSRKYRIETGNRERGTFSAVPGSGQFGHRMFPGVLLLLFLVMSLRVTAQKEHIPDPVQMTRSQSEEEISGGKARLLMEDARRLKNNGRPKKAAFRYQEVLNKNPGVMFRTEDHRFMRIHRRIRRQFANWRKSNEGQSVLEHLKSYVRGKAKKLFQEGRIPDRTKPLQKLVTRYFYTEAGRKGMIELARYHYRNGQFITAARLWKRVLNHQPDTENTCRYLLALLVCYRTAGIRKRVKRIRERLKEKLKDLPPDRADLVRKRMQNVPANDVQNQDTPKPDKTMNISSGSKNIIWSVPSPEQLPLDHPDDPFLGKNVLNEQPLIRSFQEQESKYRNYRPLNLPDRVLLQTGAKIRSIRIPSNRGSRSGNGVSPGELSWERNVEGMVAHSKEEEDTLNDLRQKGVQRLAHSQNRLFVTRKNRLICFHTASGEQIWMTKPPEPAQHVLNGNPLISGDRVFVPMISWSEDKIRVFLVCFGKEEGNFRWKTYIGSRATVQGKRWRPLQLDDVLPESKLKMAGNQIVVFTNLGFVATVDLARKEPDMITDYFYRGVKQLAKIHDGDNQKKPGEKKIKWSVKNSDLRGTRSAQSIGPYFLFLPNDMPFLMALDVHTGKVKNICYEPNARYLVGGSGNNDELRLVLVKDNRLVRYHLGRDPFEVESRTELLNANSILDVRRRGGRFVVSTGNELHVVSTDGTSRLIGALGHGNAFHVLPRRRQILVSSRGRVISLADEERFRNHGQTLFSRDQLGKNGMHFIRLLVYNERTNFAKQYVEKALSKDRDFLSDEQRERLKNLWTTLSLRN